MTKSRIRRLLVGHERWGDERELTHAIYGTIVGTAAMAVASGHATLAEMVVTVVITVAVYWVAERYAEVLAAAVHGPGRRRSRIAEALRRGWPTVEAAYTPLVVLVGISLVTGQLRTGVLAALGVSTAMLSALGYVAARRGGVGWPGALAWAAASAALGIVVIVLKTFLH
jgi:hypothetical protein